MEVEESTNGDDDQQWCIDENETMGTVLETTKFRCAVYKELTAERPLTIDWLMDQLRLLVGDLPRRVCSVSTTTAAIAAKHKLTMFTTTLDQLMDQSTGDDNATDSECTPFKLKRFTRNRSCLLYTSRCV